ncbi:MATE family efflux transporter [Paenibacillus spongiae]|uniref:Probable multidrug resistance protein NorM n=1 Tax=Paenibacillus spongiae TaxID=2909671 RepID=A0ABY5SBG2_9BACL|nr:MATE family efflux transporter [Paenibacillus spongiae]UVI31291.1 MATE family efflux transporter [Paenibacillus spongiae]
MSKQTLRVQDDFYPQLYRLAIPLTLQFLFTSSFSLIDSLMVASLGEKAIAAVGIAGQLEFLLGMILAGVLSGPAVFMAQYYGLRNYAQIKKLIGMTVFCALAISSLYVLIVNVFSPYVFMPFTNDDQLLDMTASFMSIVSYGFVASAVTMAFSLSLKCVGIVKEIMYITILALLLNTLLNYALIYGHFGFDAMGVNGAAAATLCSKAVAMLLILIFVYVREKKIAISFADLFRFDRPLMAKVSRVTLPIIIHESFWGLGMTMYMVAFGLLGTSALAIVQVSKMIGNFVSTGIQGFSQAATVMIGERIGLGKPMQAQLYAKRFTIIGTASAGIVGLLLFMLAPFVIRLFQISPDLHEQAVQVIRIMSLTLVFNFLNNIWIVGVFRSGGDTRFSLWMVLSSTWLIGIPLTFIGAGVMNWPIEVVYGLYTTEEIAKAVIGYTRYRSNRWQNNLVESEAEHQPARGREGLTG